MEKRGLPNRIHDEALIVAELDLDQPATAGTTTMKYVSALAYPSRAWRYGGHSAVEQALQ